LELNHYIKQKGIKIIDLARSLKLDPSFLSRAFSGQRKLQAVQIKKIAVLIDMPLEELQAYFLALEVQKILQPYPKLVNKVFTLTEERIAYLSGKKRNQKVQLPPKLEALLVTLSELQRQWQAQKPLENSQLQKLQTYFNLAYTYESNRIEGNTLSLQETNLVVNEGITVGGKTLQEHLEAINHQEAIHFIEQLVVNLQTFNKSVLLQLHRLILMGIDTKNAGVYRTVEVRISGSKHVPPSPLLLNDLMEGYFEFYELNKRTMHPVLLAAEMHERLVTIHPFIDGNGRTARLVMNLVLLQNGYTLVNIKGNLKNRLKYYQALEQVQLNHEHTEFFKLILSSAEKSLLQHLELAG
jgi:Fic family protein